MEKLIVNRIYRITAMLNGLTYEAIAVYLGRHKDDVYDRVSPESDMDICEFACEFGATMTVPYAVLTEIEPIVIAKEKEEKLLEYGDAVHAAIVAKQLYLGACDKANSVGDKMFAEAQSIPTWVFTKKVGELIDGIYESSNSNWEVYLDGERKTLVIAEYLKDGEEYAAPDYLLERSADEVKYQKDEDGYPIAFAYLYKINEPTSKKELEGTLERIRGQIYN